MLKLSYNSRITKLCLFILILSWWLISGMATSSAISENLVIYQVQTGGVGTGTSSQEIILLYNTSPQDVKIDNWCLQYSAGTNGLTFTKLVCFTPTDPTIETWLSSGGILSAATNEFVSVNPLFTPDYIFSAGLAATSGHVRLVDDVGAEVDRVGWGTALYPEGTASTLPASGQVLSRNLSSLNLDSDVNSIDFSSGSFETTIISGLYEQTAPVDLCLNIEGLQTEIPIGFLSDDSGDCYEDLCANIDGLQTALPEGYELVSGNCNLIPLENRTIIINELYPDAPSYDTGQEFIELYNPNSSTVNLSGYRIQVGPNYTKEYILGDANLQAGGYTSFSDTETGIILPNTTGVSLRLVSPAGNVVSETPVYQNAKDTLSWALVTGQWIYTNQISRNAENRPYLEPAQDEVLGVTTVLAACPAGKYRNPETNRCRTIETAVSSLVPCDEDEYRNPDTNRCRKISTATSSSLTPCPEGQERNPDTNRCRKISTIPGVSDIKVLSDFQDVPSNYRSNGANWALLGFSVTASISYIIYEWRRELIRKIKLFKLKFSRE